MAQLNQAVIDTMGPIVRTMTQFYERSKANPLLGPHTETTQEKIAKRQCVHRIEQNGKWEMAVRKTPEGCMCEACGRRLNIDLDENAVKTLISAIEIIDGLVLLAPQQGLDANCIKALIATKVMLSGVATIQQSLNKFSNLENAARNGAGGGSANIVANYDTPDPRITGIM